MEDEVLIRRIDDERARRAALIEELRKLILYTSTRGEIDTTHSIAKLIEKYQF